MTKKDLTNTQMTNHILTPVQQQEQALLLEPFYERLIGLAFDDSSSAVERCRDLCAEFGFTVKQEASTHRNIYVYCSREGLPDSLRNPKTNPQRKRPSKRCDCRWRIVLFENEHCKWEFRKSLNPEAGKHNHELMRPEEIERSWPKEVIDAIFELARLRMTTQDIRTRVRQQFPDIHWNERRFYNRLSEERQKIKFRDSTERTHQLSELWSKVCMATAGNDDLFQFVRQELVMLFQSICETVQIQPDEFPSPLVFYQETEASMIGSGKKAARPYAPPSPPSSSSSTSKSDIPKGYLPVEVPRQVYYIKIHNQRQLQESQYIKTAQQQKRVRPEESTPMMHMHLHSQQERTEPPKKQARKGKSKQLSPLILSSDQTNNNTIAAHAVHVGTPNSATTASLPSTPNMHTPMSRMVSSAYSRASGPLTPPPPRSSMQQISTPTSASLPSQQNFVYAFGLDTQTLSGYVHPTAFHTSNHHQSNYNIDATPTTPGFPTTDMSSFTFDTQSSTHISRSSMDSNSVQQQQDKQRHSPSIGSTQLHSPSSSTSSNQHHHHHHHHHQMYSMPATPMYDSPPKDNHLMAPNMINTSTTPPPSVSYHPSVTHQQAMFMNQSPSPNHHSMMPIYQHPPTTDATSSR
ncbi:hypothetical protein A0J61_07403 [Choanephora cucurbitarum]|uniref:FAR1 domain-containing protein n=1 Tax=Choanephora cucurbitarum TaxID=101091 RepID=A0A1C7N699_9FUNG|nr:hypothetical protein A0J61_07403 [Choanephora cucurbitarum]